MQTADDRKLDHLAGLGRLHGARVWRVLAERKMRAAPVVVIGNESAEQLPQMTLVQHDDVVQ